MDSVMNENYNDEKKKLEDEEEHAANAEGSEFDDSKAKFINGGKGLEDTQIVVVDHPSKEDSFTGLGKEELMQYANDPFWVRTRIILFILFWVGWIAMLAAAIIIIVLAPRCPHRPDQKWWNKEVVYQVYPKSFKDGGEVQDGKGDLKGIAEKFDYFKNLTANVLWLNPIFESDLIDSGYDVINHKNISKTFGTEADLQDIIKKLHKKGNKLVLDFIPNHTSKKHIWFEKSQRKEGKYTNYYVWASGTQGTPPNNWKSVHGGSAWAFDDVRNEFYLHQYLDMEPDLNLTNPDVLEEMDSILRHWLEMGVDGFHVVGAPYLVEREDLEDEPLSGESGVTQDQYNYVDHSFTANQPGTFDLLNHFRQIVDSYVKKPGSERLLFASVKGSANATLPYLGTSNKKGVHFLLNQALINLQANCDGKCIHNLVKSQLDDKPENASTGWMLGNEDSHRFASRVDHMYIKAMHTLQMLLPGTASVYYGDEIGLMDSPVMNFNLTQDPLGQLAGEDTYMDVSRDAYRTPMRWNGEKKAGFSTGTPWLPIDDINSQPNVKAQKAVFGGYKTLEYFWRLVTIRKEPSFQWGKLSYSVTDKEVFSFVRKAEGFPGFLVAINFGNVQAVRTFTLEDGELPKEGKVVVHTSGQHGEYAATHKLKDQSITLQPGDAFVMEL